MKKYLFYFLSHISMFTIGCYVVNEVKYNHPIENYRWAFTIASLVMFVVAYHVVVYKEKKQEELDFTADEYFGDTTSLMIVGRAIHQHTTPPNRRQ